MIIRVYHSDPPDKKQRLERLAKILIEACSEENCERFERIEDDGTKKTTEDKNI